MSIFKVVGKTEVTINLNKIGVPIRGKSIAILNIDDAEKEAEMRSVEAAGLIQIINEPPVLPIKENIVDMSNSEVVEIKKGTSPKLSKMQDVETQDDNGNQEETQVIIKKRGGRPKGSKNKKTEIIKEDKLGKQEKKRVTRAEDRTQQMGSKVTIGTIDGVKSGKMTRSAAEDIIESEQTMESIKAMQKIQEEENKALEKNRVDESSMPVSDQNGRNAIIADESGPSKVKMCNNSIPGSDEIKNSSPFIDDSKGDNGDEDDSFLEI
jgi:hypothetical protein